MTGYVLGKSIPNLDRYIYLVVAIVILLSLLPGILHFWKEYRTRGSRMTNVE
jgi:hypothetical protein